MHQSDLFTRLNPRIKELICSLHTFPEHPNEGAFLIVSHSLATVYPHSHNLQQLNSDAVYQRLK